MLMLQPPVKCFISTLCHPVNPLLLVRPKHLDQTTKTLNLPPKLPLGPHPVHRRLRLFVPNRMSYGVRVAGRELRMALALVAVESGLEIRRKTARR